METSSQPIPLVDLIAQYQGIKSEMDEAIQAVLNGGKFVGGSAVDQFAGAFAEYCEVPHCVPCGNGTDALEIALASLGIGHGDEVIIPDLTFVATLEAVCNVGAKPVLCDIDPHRYTIDPIKAISLVNDRTKAIIPVHLYGQMADMDPLISFAIDHHLFIIEDAAQAHGASYKGQTAGSVGDINTFSFYPGKNLGAYGDAGALTTKSEWLAMKALKLSNHGRISKYNHESVGRCSRMDTLQATILGVKLKHLKEWIHRRRQIADRYRTALGGSDQIILPRDYPESPSAYHLFVIRVDHSVRDDLRRFLKQAGIETGVHYPTALSQLPVTTGPLHIHTHCPESEKASKEVISLPIYPELTAGQQDYICDQIIRYFNIMH